MLVLPVLRKDDSWETMENKLLEETDEVIEAKDEDNRVEEIIDVMQVCIGMLTKAEKETPGILRRKNTDHVKKLRDRKWFFERVLRLEED